MRRSIRNVVYDILHINYVSDFGPRLKFETIVSVKDKSVISITVIPAHHPVMCQAFSW